MSKYFLTEDIYTIELTIFATMHQERNTNTPPPPSTPSHPAKKKTELDSGFDGAGSHVSSIWKFYAFDSYILGQILTLSTAVLDY